LPFTKTLKVSFGNVEFNIVANFKSEKAGEVKVTRTTTDPGVTGKAYPARVNDKTLTGVIEFSPEAK